MLTLLVIAIGLASAFVPNSVQDYVRATFDPNWLTEAFGILVITTAAIYFFRERAVERARQDAQRRLEVTTNAIPTLVSTIPLPSFQSSLNLAFEKCLLVATTAATNDQRVRAIQFVLQAIARAAQEFDRTPDGTATPPVTYCANILWMMASNNPAAQPWDPLVTFRSPGAVLATSEGLLALEPRLSANQGVAPDPKIAAIAFEIPRNHGKAKTAGGLGYQVLPGAPFAILPCSSFEYFHPANKLGEWFRNFGDFSHAAQHEVEQYFANHEHDIFGFLSIRLCASEGSYVPEEERVVIGVLNVHWSRDVALLANAEAARKFTEAIFPLRALLADLMVKMKDAGYVPVPA